MELYISHFSLALDPDTAHRMNGNRHTLTRTLLFSLEEPEITSSARPKTSEKQLDTGLP